MVARAVAGAGDKQDFFVSGKTARARSAGGGGQQCIFYGRVHAGRERHFSEKIKPKIAWPSAGVRVVARPAWPDAHALGYFTGVLVVGVIGADMILIWKIPTFWQTP